MNDRTADRKSGRAAVLAIGLLGVILSAILWGPAGILLGQSLQPTSPAKEYVYVGGRLVAVEVPAPGGGTPVTVTVTPSTASLGPSESVVLTAAVSAGTVAWTCNPLCDPSTVGTLVVAGLSATFTAPDPIVASSVTVKATSDLDAGISDSTVIALGSSSSSLPDLLMSSIDVQPQATAGASIPVSFTIQNSGTGTAGSFTTNFYLSTNSTITTGDTFLESYVLSSLSPGSISNSVDIIVPAVSAGNYFIGAIVDSNGDVVEDIETNNTASTPMEVVTGGGGGLPDLKALSIYLPTVVQPGGTLTFPFVRVLNANSGTSADQTFWMGIYFSDDKVITTADDRVGECSFPGGIGSDPSVDCASGPFNIAAPLVEGSYRTGTIADYLNDIPETDETNNAFLDAEPIIVSLSAAHPELLVSSLSTPAVTNPGGTITVDVTVLNQLIGGNGGVEAQNVLVGFFLTEDIVANPAGQSIGTCLIPGPFVSGTSASCPSTDLTIPSNLAPGSYKVFAFVDPDNTVLEMDETNNKHIHSIELEAVVIVSPVSVSLGAGATQVFSATTFGMSNTAVTWSLSPSSGEFATSTGTYTAPAFIAAPGETVTLTATSVEDPTKFDQATITLEPVAVSLSPASVSLSVSQTQQFTPTVTNTTNTAVTWDVTPAGYGTIDTVTGIYTAPAVLATNQALTLTATSVADPLASGSATINLSAGGGSDTTPPTISISLPLEGSSNATSNVAMEWLASDDSVVDRCDLEFDSSGIVMPYPECHNGLPTGTQLSYVHIPDASKVLGLDFAEGTGTATYDRTPYGNDATLAGSTSWVSGPYGAAVNMGGSGYASIPDDPSQKPAAVTVSAWVNLDSLTSATTCGSSPTQDQLQYLAFKRNSEPFNFSGYSLLYWNISNRFHFNVDWPIAGEIDQSSAASTSAVSTGTWYHVVGTFDRPNIKIYVNGVLEGTTVHDHPIDYGNLPLFIGRTGQCGGAGNGSYDAYLNGSIDEVAIYNRALTATEIAEMYNDRAFDGAHSLKVTAFDGAGQSAVATANFTIELPDVIPPTVSINLPLEGSSNADSNIALDWLATDDRVVDRCELVLDSSGIVMPYPVCNNGTPTTTQLSYVHIPDASKVLGLDFAEGTGTATYDRTPNGNDATLAGSTSWVSGPYGTALNMGGTGYASIPDDPSQKPAAVTVSAWVNLDSLTSATTCGSSPTQDQLQYLAFKRNSEPFNFSGYSLLYWNISNRFHFNVDWPIAGEIDQSSAASTSAVSTGTWYHVVGTFDRPNIKIYVNGVLEGTTVHDHPIDYGNLPLFIGRTGECGGGGSGSYDGYLNGSIDEVAIYNRALTATEIAEMYNDRAFDGAHSLKVTAFDGAGQSAVATANFTVAPIAVSVSPADVTLGVGEQQQFTATVTGTTNTAVTWSISPAGVGTFDTATGLYTAPASIASAQTLTVTATSVQDPSRSGTANLDLVPVVVSLSPVLATLEMSQQQQFVATVTGTGNTAVTWSISPIGVGTFDAATGLYTAPALIDSAQTLTVTATSVADPAMTGTADIDLVPVGVTVSPASVTLGIGEQQQFTATVTGTTNTAVTWSISPAGVGTFDAATGLYTAPASIASAETLTVTATSVADPSKSNTATIDLEPVGVTVTPASVSLQINQQQQFTATVTGTSNTNVTWSISPAGVGGLDTATGLYTAPASIAAAQTLSVTATSDADPTKSDSATIDLVPVVVTVGPASVTLAASEQQTFTATVTGASDTSVTWSISPSGVGTFDAATGVYTAPASIASAQTLTLTATSVADPLSSAAATINLTPVQVSLSPTTVTLEVGEQQQFTATVTGATDTSVIWSISPTGVGTFDTPTGLYTAPASVASTQILTVTATSVEEPAESASATITIEPVTVSVSPGAVNLRKNETQQFTATVGGTSNTAVTWAISPVVGTISASGLYTAPPNVAQQNQQITITATSDADPSVSGTAIVTLKKGN